MTDEQYMEIDGRDIDLKQLKPLNKRNINYAKHSGFHKILASIKAIGLIEPLSVFLEDGHYVILDGFLRYEACKQLDMETVPCLVYKNKQAYTFNRNVNRLSAFQEIRMLRKSLETIDEPTIAQTFGMRTIRNRLIPTLVKQLHPNIIDAFKEDIIGRSCAREMMRVSHERQIEVFKEMKIVGDYSPTFCRALVIQTPEAQMAKTNQKRKVWTEDTDRKRSIVARLEHAEKQHDFFSGLYRQYSTDLLKITFYVRKMISNPKIEAYLMKNHDAALTRFKEIVEANG